ncbi:MAG: phosphotransferase enzyme family protein [Candidatus Heimdallarchaeota archaeon]
MMNVEIMRKYVQCFYDKEGFFVDDLIKRWEHDTNSHRMGRVSANFIYFFTHNEEQRVLRFTPEAERTEKQLLAEMDFIEFLRSVNIPVVKPILSRQNKYVESIETEDGVFNGVVFERAPGKHFETDELPEDKIFALGKLTAEFHNATLKFKPNPKNKRRTWEDEIKTAMKILDTFEDSLLREILPKLRNEVAKFVEDEFYGLIHYDLCLDNILWVDDNYYLIDLDDAAYYPFVADIAFAIDDIRDFEPKAEENFLKLYEQGYTSVKSLPKNWREQLEIFYDLEDLLKYARGVISYLGTNPEIYPPWLTKLRHRHVTKMQNDKRRLLRKWL